MLYVFQVDTGTMLTFDMNSAMDTTLALKSRLVEKLSSPSSSSLSVSSLVLLTGAGAALSNSSPIHAYGTGTDVTNPIFLFNKANIISSSSDNNSSNNNSNFQQQQQHQQIEESNNGEESVVSSSVLQSHPNNQFRIENLGLCVTSMAPTYQTLSMRSTCARRMHDVDKLVHQGSCRLFQDQNLQLHGWAAVINNLQESTAVFAKKILGFKLEFQGDQISAGGGGDGGGAQKLARDIKELVESRLSSTVDELGRTVMVSREEEADGDKKNKKTTTLLDWILAQDGSITSIEKLVENCFRLIDKLDPGIIEGIHSDADKVIHAANNSPCKEILGLDSRLEGMRDLLERSRLLLSKQSDQSTAFVTNESRFADVQDSSVLPDLCLSHQQQMVEMAKNHLELEEIRRRLLRAKEELCSNINHRLKWVIFTQKQISEISIRVNVCQETMRKLGNFDVILRQVFQAGHVYKECLREEQRRARFAKGFGEYHREVRAKVLEVTSEESVRRESFLVSHGSHFIVQALFQDLTRGLPPGINVPNPYNEEEQFKFVLVDDDDAGDDTLPSYDFMSESGAARRLVGVVAGLEEELRRVKQRHEEELERIAREQVEEVAKLRDKHRADQDGLKARIRFFSRTSSGGSGFEEAQQQQQSQQFGVIPLVVGSPGSPAAVSPSSTATAPGFSAGAAGAAAVGGSSSSTSTSQVRDALEGLLRSAPDHVVAAVLSAAGWARRSPAAAAATATKEDEEDVVVEVEDTTMDEAVVPNNNCDNLSEYDPMMSHQPHVDVVDEDDDENVDHDEMRLLAMERGVPLQSSFKKGDRVILYWSKKFDTYVAYTSKDNHNSGGGGGGQRTRKNSSSNNSNCSVNFVYNPAELALLQQQQQQQQQQQVIINSNSSSSNRDTSSDDQMSSPPPPTDVVFISTVSNREFCVARRRSNTYKVPGGFHFYRLHLQEGATIAVNKVNKKL